jgi:hypothetical protein
MSSSNSSTKSTLAKYKHFAIIEDRDGRRLVCHWMDRRFRWVFPLVLVGLNLVAWWFIEPDLNLG